MLGTGGTGGTYAGKKRKKPVQKIPKPPPPEGAKSNPSKRHRDRLNMELDKLTNLLPFSEEVRSRLDKLSVLRLSVGYLKVKSFFNATMKKSVGRAWPVDRPGGTFGGNGQNATSLDGVSFSEGELLLQALNGFVMVITAEGYVFYSSSSIQDYLGFHQSDVVHQSVFELIHTDDRDMFRRQLHFALNPAQCERLEETEALQNSSEITTNIVNYNPKQLPPENSSFLERSFCCRFRCLLDNSSGFLALNFQGRLKYLHGQNKVTEDGTMAHPQLALFVIATPLQPPSILEIRSKTLIFQTKHKLDFTPLGIDTRGKVLLGYTEIELCMRGSGYQFIHAADMMYCADNHLRMMKTGESGFTVFRLLSKAGIWIWVQASARLVYKGGRPDFIVVRQRALSNEEGEEHLSQRKLQLPFSYATGEAVLYETGPSLDMAEMANQGKGGKLQKPPAMAPSSLLSSMLKQDQSIYHPSNDPNSQFCLEKAFSDSHALLNVPGNTWQPVSSGTEGNSSAVKEEATVREMMDSLQQIIGDSRLCGTVEELPMDQEELKEWENALLQMNNITNEAEMPVELNDILANDIFSYVEDMLFKENSAGMSESLPECLSELQLQGDFEVQNDQGLNALLGGQEAPKTASPGRGMMKLTHISPKTHLPVADAFVDSLGFSDVKMTSCSNLMGFESSPAGQQNPARLAPQNDLVQRSQAPIQAGNLVYPNSVALPKLQSHGQPMGFHNQLNQSTQWVPSNESLPPNISLPQEAPLNPAPGVCLQGQFSISTQNVVNQINPTLPTWQPPLPSVQQGISNIPNMVSLHNILNVPNVTNVPNSHHHIHCGQPNNVQQDPLAQLMMQSNFGSQPSAGTGYSQQGALIQPSANALYGQQEELMHHAAKTYNQTAANTVYNQQGNLMQPSANATYSQRVTLMDSSTPAPASSCMFERVAQATVNNSAECYNAEPMMSSCQKTKAFLNQTPQQSTCFYPGGLGDNSMVVPAETNGINTNTIPCLLLGQDAMLQQQQQFLTCNGQKQMTNHPIKENGTFHLGTSCYSGNNQNNNF
ncbi:aryl hydrocarbon receptor 2 [Hoplias malabaricus]|uniref:aryl hydrocarbon receptor 2 n=1 Tax=Hoplias malabaricus TaxID=27720 RepID=UPI00346381FF